jgi:hypothetical protein
MFHSFYNKHIRLEEQKKKKKPTNERGKKNSDAFRKWLFCLPKTACENKAFGGIVDRGNMRKAERLVLTVPTIKAS